MKKLLGCLAVVLCSVTGIAYDPGGVPGVAAWFRTEPITSNPGSSLHWKDYGGESLHMMRGENEATEQRPSTGVINFNPSLRILPAIKRSDMDSAIIKDCDLTQSTVIGVFAPEFKRSSGSYPVNVSGLVWCLRDGDGNLSLMTNDSIFSSDISAGSAHGGERDNLKYDSGESAEHLMRNSVKVYSFFKASRPAMSVWGTGNAVFSAGRGMNAGDQVTGTGLKGSLNRINIFCPELCIFPRILRPLERLKVESYLAMKYGVTLTGSYLDPKGDLIWDSEGQKEFHNRVTALARDSAGNFTQVRSATSSGQYVLPSGGENEMTDSLGSHVELSKNHFLTIGKEPESNLSDGTSIIWGDDGGTTAVEDYSPEADPEAGNESPWHFMTRRWLIKRHGDISSLRCMAALRNFDRPWKLNSRSRTFLCIDRSSTGSPEPESMDTVRCSVPDNTFGKTMFHNVEWDPDGSGSDIFTFAYFDGLQAQASATPATCSGAVPLSDGTVTVNVTVGDPSFSYVLSRTGQNAGESAEPDTVSRGTFMSPQHIITGIAPGSYLLGVTQNGGSRIYGNSGAELSPTQGIVSSLKWRITGQTDKYSVDFLNGSSHYNLRIEGNRLYVPFSIMYPSSHGISEGDIVMIGNDNNKGNSIYLNGTRIFKELNHTGIYDINVTFDNGKSELAEFMTDGMPIENFSYRGDVSVENCRKRELLYQVEIGSECDPSSETSVTEITRQYTYAPEHMPAKDRGNDASGVAGPNDGTDDSSFTVRRIPDTEAGFKATLRLDDDLPATLAVYDASGRTVFTEEMEAGCTKESSFEVPAPGVYVVKAFTYGKEYTGKIISR